MRGLVTVMIGIATLLSSTASAQSSPSFPLRFDSRGELVPQRLEAAMRGLEIDGRPLVASVVLASGHANASQTSIALVSIGKALAGATSMSAEKRAAAKFLTEVASRVGLRLAKSGAAPVIVDWEGGVGSPYAEVALRVLVQRAGTRDRKATLRLPAAMASASPTPFSTSSSLAIGPRRLGALADIAGATLWIDGKPVSRSSLGAHTIVPAAPTRMAKDYYRRLLRRPEGRRPAKR